MIGSKTCEPILCQYDLGILTFLIRKKGIFQLLFPLVKLCCMRGSVCCLNFKTALDTEALSCSSWWQDDEQLALQQNIRPIQRQITHRGRCARAMYREWTSERDRKNTERWTLDFKRWPWRPVKSNSRSQWAFTCAAQSKSNSDFYCLVFQQPWITYITAKLKAK